MISLCLDCRIREQRGRCGERGGGGVYRDLPSAALTSVTWCCVSILHVYHDRLSGKYRLHIHALCVLATLFTVGFLPCGPRDDAVLKHAQ